MNMKFQKHSLILLLFFTLSGCSLFAPVKTIQDRYVLSKIPCELMEKESRPIIVMIAMPMTRPIYNTTLMAYSLRPYHIAYFSQTAWAETPPEMLLPLLVQTLQNTHYFRQVVTLPYNGPYNYILKTQILALRQDYSHCPPCLIMSVRAQIETPSNCILATKEFTVTEPFQPGTAYGGVFAANHATAEILEDIALFSMQDMV